MSTCWPGLHAGRWMTRDSLEEQLGRFRKLPVAWLRGSPRALFPRPRTAPLPLSWSRLPSAPGHAGSWCAAIGQGTAREAVLPGREPLAPHFTRLLSSALRGRRDVRGGRGPIPPSMGMSSWVPLRVHQAPWITRPGVLPSSQTVECLPGTLPFSPVSL